MEQLVKVQREARSSILIISHDISVVTEVCDRIVVMYAGKVVESCSVHDFHIRPCHPYSMGLIMAFPTLEGAARRLVSIPGFPPDLSEEIRWCVFHDRCPFRRPICREEEPPDVEVTPEHFARCHFTQQAEEFRARSAREETWEDMA
jgi:peptide/nickel transport system ATP-binding protein